MIGYNYGTDYDMIITFSIYNWLFFIMLAVKASAYFSSIGLSLPYQQEREIMHIPRSFDPNFSHFLNHS